jgi:hypothetical protein
LARGMKSGLGRIGRGSLPLGKGETTLLRIREIWATLPPEVIVLAACAVATLALALLIK